MPDREKSTPPPPDPSLFDTGDHALREVYARELLPEHREMLDRLLGVFLDVVREGVAYHRSAKEPGTGTTLDVRAALTDLQFTARALRYIKETADGSSIESYEDGSLILLALETAVAVEALAEQFEAAIVEITTEPAPPEFRLVVLYVDPAEHTKWMAAAGEAPLRTWLRGLADHAAGTAT